MYRPRPIDTTEVALSPDLLALSNMGDMLRSMGRIAEAEEALLGAVVDARKAEIPRLECSAQLNLGLALHTKGAWAEARRSLERALTLAEASGAVREKGRVTLALGNLCRDVADYESAQKKYEEVQKLARELGDRELEGSVNQSLGNMYFKRRLWEQSLPYYEKAIEIAAQTRDARLHGIAMHMLGDTHRRLNQHREALDLLHKSVSMAYACPAEVGMAGRLNDLAVVEHQMGLLAQAREHYQQGVDIYRRLGLASTDIAGCVENLGVLLVRFGEVGPGREYILQASSMDNAMVAQAFAIASEDARLEFLCQAQRRLDDLVSLVAEGGPLEGDPTTVQACADVVLRRKGASLEALAVQRDLAASGKYPQMAESLRELARVRMQLAQMTLAGKAVRQDGSYTPEAADLVERKQGLEYRVGREVPDVALEDQLRRADRRAVALHLPEDSVLVEFLRFGFFSYPPPDREAWLGADRYAAFIVHAGRPDEVRMIDLGDAAPIDQMIAEFRAVILREVGDGRDLGESTAGQVPVCDDGCGNALRRAVFDPLVAWLGDRKRLLLAPDVSLSVLPFEALPAGEGRHLIDEYRISYLSAARDVLRFGVAHSTKSGEAVVIAAPAFNLVAGGWRPRSGTRNESSRRSADLVRGDLCFAPLPGTRIEGERLARMLGVRPWLEEDALEGRIKACHSPRILHIATHGHFIEDQYTNDSGGVRDPGTAGAEKEGDARRLSGRRLENPLLRSMLAMAGANTWLREGGLPEEAEDGLLTAEDASGLDLANTELAVLSACDTGLGAMRVGQGVFGLRRAFALAGARTLVMSLWKVPDRQTQELMEDFYGRLLQGRPRGDALREAQLAMRAKHPAPFYWGGFICQGDPGPLLPGG